MDLLPNESISLQEAKHLLLVAEQAAAAMGQPTNVAVVDAGGHLVAQSRMDGAWFGSIDIALNKAFTARAFDLATDDLAQIAQSVQPAFGVHMANQGRTVIIAGGLPLRRNGRIVGAMGAAGGMPDQDAAVAQAAADAFEKAAG